MALKANVCRLGLGILGLVEAAEGSGAVGRGCLAEAKVGRPGVSVMTSRRWLGRRASGQAAAPQQGPRTIWKARA